jgi:hypothetical protein
MLVCMALDPIIDKALKEYANSFFAPCLTLKRRPYKFDEPIRIPLMYDRETKAE